MILLDTNIISELMKQAPAEQVIYWIDQQESSELFVSTITIAEIKYGLTILSDGKRQQSLEKAFNDVIQQAFKHRVLSFNESAASIYGTIMGHRKSLGQPLSILDGQIAAIALANQASLATRNTKDFRNCNLHLVNPFQEDCE